MNPVLQEAAAEFSLRQTAKDAAFQELTQLIAAGQSLDAAELADQLAALGKTPGQLAEAVKYREERAAWRAEADHLKEREAAWNQARAAVDAKAAEWQQVQTEYTQALQALSQTAQAAQVATSQSYTAVASLRRNYRGPLTSALTETEAESQRLIGVLGDAKTRRNHILWNLEGPVAKLMPPPKATREKLKMRLDEVDGEIARLEKGIEDSLRPGPRN